MTTPERFRRRQRIESAGIVALAAGLVFSVVYFQGQDSAQDRCLSTFVSTNSETTAIRSQAVALESKATRSIINDVFTAEGRGQVREAFKRYTARIARVDQLREDNPVPDFPEGLCN